LFGRLIALIELAEGPLACTTMVTCVERTITKAETTGLVKGLQWAGFSATTLEHWAFDMDKSMDLTSQRWLFMGMEL
jgi:hypothetical protein